jgi:hypothetical protein
MPFPQVCLLFALVLTTADSRAAGPAGPAVDQLKSVHHTRSGRQVYDGGARRSPSAVRLGSKRPGSGTARAVARAHPGATARRSAIKPVPTVHAAKGKLNLPKGTYGSAPPHFGWDYDRTVFAAGVALGGAAIGFLLGGPIGAAMGFVAGFFIGALVGKATGVGS